MNNRERFNKLSSKWDDVSKLDPLKLKKIVDLIDLKKSSYILDVGTGTGVLIPFLLEHLPQKIIGLDVSDGMIEVAKSKFDNSSVDFVVGDVMNTVLKGFDFVILHNVYPHIENKQALFSKVSEILNDNGVLVITHSISREQVNSIHRDKRMDKVERLQEANFTASLMEEYFEVTNVIDDEIYFVKGIKK